MRYLGISSAIKVDLVVLTELCCLAQICIRAKRMIFFCQQLDRLRRSLPFKDAAHPSLRKICLDGREKYVNSNKVKIGIYRL
jgi:hypothetical protein